MGKRRTIQNEDEMRKRVRIGGRERESTFRAIEEAMQDKKVVK